MKCRVLTCILQERYQNNEQNKRVVRIFKESNKVKMGKKRKKNNDPTANKSLMDTKREFVERESMPCSCRERKSKREGVLWCEYRVVSLFLSLTLRHRAVN